MFGILLMLVQDQTGMTAPPTRCNAPHYHENQKKMWETFKLTTAETLFTHWLISKSLLISFGAQWGVTIPDISPVVVNLVTPVA